MNDFPPPQHDPGHAAFTQPGGLGYNPAADPTNPASPMNPMNPGHPGYHLPGSPGYSPTANPNNPARLNPVNPIPLSERSRPGKIKSLSILAWTLTCMVGGWLLIGQVIGQVPRHMATVRAVFNPDVAAVAPDQHWLLLQRLPVRPRNSEPATGFDRADWGTDAGGGCWTTRTRELIAASLESVARDPNCRVLTGLWIDPWTGDVKTLAAALNIDHHVPLLDAHQAGGAAWNPERKQDYANDPAVLTVIGKQTNQRKSANTPDAWMPSDRSSWCRYARDWIDIKHKYELSVTRAEKRALHRMLRSCG